MDLIKASYILLWGLSIWDILYILSLVYIWVKRRERGEAYNAFFWIAVLSCLFLFNPIVGSILIPKMNTYLEYTRLSWVFFIVPVIAYAWVELFSVLERREKSVILLITIAVIWFAGTAPMYRFETKENAYKLTDETIAIHDLITENESTDGRIRLAVVGEGAFGADAMPAEARVYYGIRQYDYQFIMSMGHADDISSGKLVLSPGEYLVITDESYHLIEDEPTELIEIGQVNQFHVFEVE